MCENKCKLNPRDAVFANGDGVSRWRFSCVTMRRNWGSTQHIKIRGNNHMYSSIHYLHPLVPGLGVTEVTWSLS